MLALTSPRPVTIYSDLLALSYDMKPLTLILAARSDRTLPGGSPATRAQRHWTTPWAVQPEVIYNMGAMSLGLYAAIAGTSASGSGIGYQIEPYVKLNDFGVRISFLYSSEHRQRRNVVHLGNPHPYRLGLLVSADQKARSQERAFFLPLRSLLERPPGGMR